MLRYLSDRLEEQVRGAGLSYGVGLNLHSTKGYIGLDILSASHPVEAFKIIQNILRNHIENVKIWDKNLVASARGSIIYTLVANEETKENLIEVNLKAYLRGNDINYNRKLIYSVAEVKLEDLKKAAKTILPQFLSPNLTQTVVVCHPNTIRKVKEEFMKVGFNLTVFDSLEDSYLAT